MILYYFEDYLYLPNLGDTRIPNGKISYSGFIRQRYLHDLFYVYGFSVAIVSLLFIDTAGLSSGNISRLNII